MKINHYYEPWEYLCVDDFLSPQKYKALENEFNTISWDLNKDVDRKIEHHDNTPEIFNFMNYFKIKRGYETHKRFIHLTSTKPNLVHPIHVDSEFKIMSAVLYVGENNKGTRLYKTKDGPVITEVEWKPNRLFVFCGMDDITWHDYTSSGQRFTYNYFVVDPTKITNSEYKNNLV